MVIGGAVDIVEFRLLGLAELWDKTTTDSFFFTSNFAIHHDVFSEHMPKAGQLASWLAGPSLNSLETLLTTTAEYNSCAPI